MFSCCNFNINVRRVSIPLLSDGSNKVSSIDKESKYNPTDEMKMEDKIDYSKLVSGISTKIQLELFEHSLRGRTNTPNPVFCQPSEEEAWISLATAQLTKKFNAASEGKNHYEELKKMGYKDFDFLVKELIPTTIKHIVRKMYQDDYRRDFKLEGHVSRFTPIMNDHLNLTERYVCQTLNWDLRLNKLEDIAYKTKTCTLNTEKESLIAKFKEKTRGLDLKNEFEKINCIRIMDHSDEVIDMVAHIIAIQNEGDSRSTKALSISKMKVYDISEEVLKEIEIVKAYFLEKVNE